MFSDSYTVIYINIHLIKVVDFASFLNFKKIELDMDRGSRFRLVHVVYI